MSKKSMTILATLASFTASAASTNNNHGHHLLHMSPHRSLPQNGQHLRQRATQEKKEETNDDDKTRIPLLPFSLQLSNIPPSSPLAMNVNNNPIASIGVGGIDGDGIAVQQGNFAKGNSPQEAQAQVVINSILEHVNVMGSRTFTESSVYGDRFEEWNVGNDVWSSEFVVQLLPDDGDDGGSESSPVPAAVASEANSSPLFDDRRMKMVRGGGRRLQDDDSSNTGTTTMVTLGHNGTVTFNGLYWEDDPTSYDVTAFLVSELNSDGNREELKNKLSGVVCTSEELTGGECNLEVMVVASDATAGDGAEDVGQENVVQEETVTQNVPAGIDESEASKEEAEPETVIGNDGDQVTTDTSGTDSEAVIDPSTMDPSDPANPSSGETVGDEATTTTTIDPADTTTVNGLASESPDSRVVATAPDEDDDSNIIIPIIAVGASMVAFALAALVFLKVRKKNARDENRKIEANTTAEMEESPRKQEAEAVWANSAHDAITASNNGKSVSSPRVSAAAAAATSATATAQSSSGNDDDPNSNKDMINIDNILDDFSDGGSSFISDSSTSGSAISHISGLTGIMGGDSNSPNPLLDHVQKMQHPSLRLSVDNSGDNGGYLPESLQKGNSPSMRKQESFEGTYRTRSAMAKLNLKKDILHVECETHDAPEGSSDGEDGDDMNIGAGSAAAGKGYGITRTISPRKSTTMMEKQRLAEKVSLRDRIGKTTKEPKGHKKSKGEQQQQQQTQKKEENEDLKRNEKDLILPVDFQRSDSVDLRSKDSSSGSDGSEEDFSDMV
eukprot:CAMPEP_0172303000 /NCGR_PEP_ID=MMETSP1058-20130122/4612_1 /TAXON_ID=83371 /ORGANISM="Detonula confervacea, Strain CCMP 353" /LENGTH=785 /DNA_ID=CAMNT_0013013677 /DNA_START=189 /DNA_END=2546 /DNA_ORIENTATION=+